MFQDTQGQLYANSFQHFTMFRRMTREATLVLAPDGWSSSKNFHAAHKCAFGIRIIYYMLCNAIEVQEIARRYNSMQLQQQKTQEKLVVCHDNPSQARRSYIDHNRMYQILCASMPSCSYEICMLYILLLVSLIHF